MAEVEVVSAQEDPTEEDSERIGTLSNVMKEPEVVIGQPETVPVRRSGRRMVKVRLNESIEEMSVVAGGKREVFSFEAGHEYTVPVDIAIELERLGKVWH